jgi:microcystin-dependent protein
MTAEMPSHTHAVTDPGHAHGYVEPVGGVNVGGIAASVPADVATATTDPASTGITLANTGGGAAHNNVQPTIICNKIIRAL